MWCVAAPAWFSTKVMRRNGACLDMPLTSGQAPGFPHAGTATPPDWHRARDWYHNKELALELPGPVIGDLPEPRRGLSGTLPQDSRRIHFGNPSS